MPRNCKRFLSILLACLLVFSNFNGIIVHAAEEEGNQSFSIHVDKSEAGPNEDVLVSINTAGEENITGIAVNYKLPDGKYTGISTKFNPSTGNFEAAIPVRDYSAAGLWSVVGIDTYYKDGQSGEILEFDADLSGGNFTVVNENTSVQDTTAPVFNRVSIDKTEASPGEVVKVSLDAGDDLSGISLVKIIYNGNSSKSALAFYNEQTEKYEANIAIQEDELVGDMELNEVYIRDYAGNNYMLYYDEKLSPGNFKVVEKSQEVIDEQAPVLHGVAIDKDEVSPGEQVTVSLDVTDNHAGVKDVIVTYQNEYAGSWEVNAVYNQETGKYDAVFPVDHETRTGKWSVPYIVVTDQNDNHQTYWYSENQYFDSIAFTVINETENDVTPPVVNGMFVDKQEVKVGEEVTLSLDVTDDSSGVQEVYVQYWNDHYGSLNQNAYYNELTKKYEVKFPVTYTTGTGKWRVDYILVSDNQHNSNYYYDGDLDFTSSEFTVLTDGMDEEAPIFNGVSVDKTEAQLGETVTISIDAVDAQAGIDYVYVELEGPKYEYPGFIAEYNAETGKYEVQFTVDEQTNPGKWEISSLFLYDNAANGIWLNDGIEFNIDFSVINENIDSLAPEVSSVSVDKVEAYPGDTVTISIDAKDDKTGIEYVRANIWIGNMSQDYQAYYNSETEKYEVELLVEESSRPGTWRVNSIFVMDKANNFRDLYSGGDFDGSQAEIVVINENVDSKAPTINSISVDKKEVHYGETVTISIDAFDQSEISYLELLYSSPYGGYDYYYPEFNSKTNKYELSFTVDENTAPGVWSLDRIYVQDNVGNYDCLYTYDGVELSGGNYTVINEKYDTTPPEVNSVTVDKKEAVPGDTVKVSLDVTEDLSEVDSVYVYFNGSIGGDMGVYAQYNSETQLYEVDLPITESFKPGEWGIYFVEVTNNKGYGRYYYDESDADFSAADFTVINENADIMPPTIQGVSVDKTEAQPGDTVTVSIDAVDDKTGIDYAAVQFYAGDRYLDELEAVYNYETGKYEVKLTIEELSRPGVWSISSIYVRDKEYNGDRYYNDEDQDFRNADFTVINENADMTPPTVNGVTVDKHEAQPGETVTLSIDAVDDKTKISYMEVRYRNDYYGSQYQEAGYNSETNKFEVSIPVTDETMPGLWRLDRIYLEDSEGNYDYIYYYDDVDLSGGDYTVINDSVDVTPPAVNSVSVDKTDAVPGDTVKVSLDVTEDLSEVDSVYVYFNGSIGGDMGMYAQYNSETQLYEVDLPITESFKPGEWGIYFVEVTNNKGYGRYYYDESDADFSAADFTVINDKIDIAAPEIMSVSVDKTEANPGDTVTVSIDAVDDKSAIATVAVDFQTGSKYLEDQQAIYNPETGKYEVKLAITDTARPGQWRINSIYVMDEKENEERFYNGGYEYDFSGADFTVFNENADITAPTVQSITVDKTEALPGDTVKVSIEASDDRSKVSYIRVDYRNQYGGNLHLYPEYNSDTNKYEVSIPITPQTKPGLWNLETIELGDSEGNYDSVYYYEGVDFNAGDFTVINDNADITPPSVNRVSVDKTEAVPGDTIIVSLDVTDESGMENVYVNFEGYGASIGMPAEYNPETNLYEALLSITDNFRPGQWSIDSVEVRDQNENQKYLYNGVDADFSAADFTVFNENVDVMPPTILGVSVDKKEAHFGEQVTFSVEAKDDKSEMEEVRVVLQNFDYGSMDIVATYNEATGQYEAKLDITDSIRSGDWSIWAIYASDVNYNGNYFYNGEAGNDFSNADFIVINENEDKTPPIVQGASVNKKEVQAEEEVTITIDAKDEQSEIGYISVSYRMPNGNTRTAGAYYNYETEKYEAKLEVGQYAKAGVWKIDGIYVSDNYGNSKYIFNNNLGGYPGSEGMDFSNGDFVVVNENEDRTAPEINSIKVNKVTYGPGETATVELDVIDTQSGVSYVSVSFTGSNGGYMGEQAYYNETTQRYEAQIQITDTTKPGVWEIGDIYVNDNEGNSNNLSRNEYDFSGSNFTVINEAVDITPPTVNSISVDKKEVQLGEEVTVSFDVKDIQSTIREVWVVLTNKNENDPWGFSEPLFQDAVYNEETQLFEVKIPVTEGMKPGTWMVEYVSVVDSEENWISLRSETDADFLSSSKFNVINDLADVTIPAYKGVTADKKVVNVGEEITFSVDASDESGIQNVFMVLDGTMDTYEAIYNPDTNKYDISIPINEYYKPGTWKVQSITIYDNEDNAVILEGENADFSDVDFEIVNDDYAKHQEYLATYINSISVDKKVAKPGDKVTLSINFKDSSNIKEVRVDYTGGNETYFMREAVFNNKTGNFEVEVSISPLFRPTLWNLVSINVTEQDDEMLYFGNGNADVENGDFSVSNNALDAIAPAAPEVDQVTDKTVTVIGTTEPRVKVIVKAGEQELGQAISDYEGKFSISIDAQKAGTALTVTAIDSSENESEATTVNVADLTAPEVPTIDSVSDHSEEVTGTTEAGAKVTITINSESYTATADQSGNYKVTMPVQKAGTVITVTAEDAAGNVSAENKVTVEDKTAPSVPTVNTVTDKSGAVIGKTEPGAEVKVTIGTTSYPYTASSTGYFKVLIPTQKAGTIITVTATDAAGNVSEETKVTVEDKTAPSVPTVNTVTDKSGAVIGKTEANAEVTVKIGTTSYPYTASATGYFKVTIPVQKAGTKITVTATDAAGNVSAAQTVTVEDKTAPSVPTVNAVTDKATSVIGKTEAGAAVIVKIGTAEYPYTASATGYFKVTIPVQKEGTQITVTAKDAAGNVSAGKTITVLDKTAPSVPTVNTVTDKSTAVIGKTEANAAVTVKIGTKSYPYTASATGYFKVTIPAQKADTKITVTAKDAAGNVSAGKMVSVLDKTAPSAPTVNTVTNRSEAVIGKTEANATVTVKIGTTSYSVTASSTGYFKVAIPAQKAGIKITVTAKDAAGNVSAAQTVIVVDKTAPAAPKVNPVTDRSGAVIGRTEANATVTVTIGTMIYQGTASGTGYYKIVIPFQKAGTIITVTSADASENVSEATTVTVID